VKKIRKINLKIDEAEPYEPHRLRRHCHYSLAYYH